MNRMVIISIAVLPFLWAVSAAGEDYNFETTREEMIRKLTKPPLTGAQSRPRTRSLGGVYNTRDKAVATRGIQVIERQGEKEIEKMEFVPVERTDGFVNLKIQFDYNSYAIRRISMPLLNELGEALSSEQLRSRPITIIGHTDSDGNEKYNLRLSLKRADSVKYYLVREHAIDPLRLRVLGYGEGMPLVSNDSSTNKQINRRVEIVAAE